MNIRGRNEIGLLSYLKVIGSSLCIAVGEKRFQDFFFISALSKWVLGSIVTPKYIIWYDWPQNILYAAVNHEWDPGNGRNSQSPADLEPGTSWSLGRLPFGNEEPWTKQSGRLTLLAHCCWRRTAVSYFFQWSDILLSGIIVSLPDISQRQFVTCLRFPDFSAAKRLRRLPGEQEAPGSSPVVDWRLSPFLTWSHLWLKALCKIISENQPNNFKFHCFR